MFRFKMPARRPRRGTPKLSGLLFFNYFPGSTAMIKRMMMSALFLGAPLTLCAAPDSAPDGMMSLSAQASAQVPQDVVHITLFHEQQANTAAPLTAALKQKTDQALREARAQNRSRCTLARWRFIHRPIAMAVLQAGADAPSWYWNPIILKQRRNWLEN